MKESKYYPSPIIHGIIKVKLLNGEEKELYIDRNLSKVDLNNKEILILTHSHIKYCELDAGYLHEYDNHTFLLSPIPDSHFGGIFRYSDIIAWGYTD